jgi:sporadic carbohydrate cluster protein (TIGR04323 family)
MSFKNLKKYIYQGYVQLMEFNNIYLPAPIQNLIMKNFCEQNNAIFKLSVNEHYIKNCYMELFFILKKIKYIDGLIMSSIYMLPQDIKNFSYFIKLYKKRKLKLIFIFENKEVNNSKELLIIYKKYSQYKSLNKIV